jgi:hypothetical protein
MTFTENTIALLSECPTRLDAQALLQGCTVAQLALIEATVTGTAHRYPNRADAVDNLVELLVGRREDSDAIMRASRRAPGTASVSAATSFTRVEF